MAPPDNRRIGVPAPLLGALCGALLGLIAFAAVATLWRLGATHAAAVTAASALLVALSCLAGTILFGQPARRIKARVPVNRALPPSWWPRESESVPLIAACLGVPVILGTGAAVLIFH